MAEYNCEVPASVIHRIHSFLTHRDSARTTLLSKSWRVAWLTRPTIVLDESHFPRHRSSSHPNIDGLTLFAKTTFRRYEASNLRIHTFQLCLDSKWYGPSGLAAKWISKALKLGATDLTLGLRLGGLSKTMATPIDELFGYENVVRLCLQGFDIGRQPTVIKCSGLKSLTLGYLCITSDSMFNIISCCPMIEYMSLSNIYSTECFPDRYTSGNNMVCLQKLASLVMCHVEPVQFQSMFLDDLSSKFPNLKDLTLSLSFCQRGQEMIQIISSHSLETLNIKVHNDEYYDKLQHKRRKVTYRVDLYVPSVCEFTYEGSCIPKLSFRSTSRVQWESHVSITQSIWELSTLWFCELNNFLTKLRGSKIHLCLHLHDGWESVDQQMGEIHGLNVLEIDDLMIGLNVCEVEDLTIETKGLPSLRFSNLLDGLFRICHPKMITHCIINPPYKADGGNTIDNDLLLCRALEQGLSMKSLLMINKSMLGLLDLEELHVQKLFDDRLNEWIALDSTSDDSQIRCRFQLKWKP